MGETRSDDIKARVDRMEVGVKVKAEEEQKAEKARLEEILTREARLKLKEEHMEIGRKRRMEEFRRELDRQVEERKGFERLEVEKNKGFLKVIMEKDAREGRRREEGRREMMKRNLEELDRQVEEKKMRKDGMNET
eukprot:CAMPEP_0168319564 /NCGR_PEP_ID=MMETSP0213-20121227/1132_1 /TAXON_ID=151035 /ORGANISM="Euplotes harpa, Strain FSP1.4" /LENGTH=135 /DNA_ID=CAMNT_0008320811 /DNA_START=703 /DNA_END=1106 /DNA_ORIENTATION=+